MPQDWVTIHRFCPECGKKAKVPEADPYWCNEWHAIAYAYITAAGSDNFMAWRSADEWNAHNKYSEAYQGGCCIFCGRAWSDHPDEHSAEGMCSTRFKTHEVTEGN